MSQINDKDSNEFNNFYVEEVIKSKESSHETGEYNEIKILNGLISNTEEEEDSSSDEEESTSKTVAIGTTVGMTVGIGGVVIGAIASITLSLNFLAAQSVVGITEAQCYFELTNANYNEIDIQLEDINGEKIQLVDLEPTETKNQYVAEFNLVDLEPTETKNQYVAEFNHLSPNSTYFVKGLDDDGKEIDLGENNYFKTLQVPSYDIEINLSKYDKANEEYNLSFIIDNPHEYLIEAILICENDKTLNQFAESSDGIFDFTLHTILSTYRLELYQEDYLVGQTTFNDYEGIQILDESLEIGISSIDMALSLGEVDPNDIVISIINNDNPEEVIPLEVALDGDILYVRYYELEPENSYTLVINDANRPSFSYFSYDFTTIPIPQYEISIDESSFDIENQNYVLTFNIDNPNGYLIDANLYCLNDDTYDDYYLIMENSLTIRLPILYSEYRLDLSQEGNDVGSISFSYYTPMELVLDTLNITSTSFEVEVKLGDIPLDTFSAFLIPEDNQDNELELEIMPLDNSSRIRLSMGDLMSDTSYTLELRDSFRSTTVYLNYAFNTLA